jgi:ATP-dependent protease ClpP protease subunit
MYKRKVEQYILSIEYNCVNFVYKNPLNTDSIGMVGNHIIFNCNITNETVSKIFETIKNINELSNCIYLHIASFGGSLDSLNLFIHTKNTIYPNLVIISVIEKNCSDAGFLLAALCDYRIIKKNTICSMSVLNSDTKYWGAYLQGDDIKEKIEFIFDKTKYKVKKEKFMKYLSCNNTFKCKKMLKMGLIDQIY